MPAAQHDIVLTTLNARYLHTAFGLRYLLANLGALAARAVIEEFTVSQRPVDIAESLLAHRPRIIGFGVYIWNVAGITRTVELIRAVSPDTVIVLGGPEVSHPPDLPAVCGAVDYVLAGAAEKTFRELCERLLAGDAPAGRVIACEPVPLDALQLPYALYDEDDIANRLIYVEASRGCPYRCEFCLSALDRTAKAFSVERFLAAMDGLYRRGVRNFKFIDRTFNLKLDACTDILEFFLARMDADLYLHFEVIPDKLPARLKNLIQRFPPHSLQFEIGVQTFDESIQRRISRKQDNAATAGNLHWLRRHTGVYLHADLIFGLPGDTLDNFARSFDRLVELAPHEIQLGILKRLRGAPIDRHSEKFDMRYNPWPPYDVLATRDIDFATMQRVNRCARYWDMIANSGRFPATLPLILGDAPFANFIALSDALYSAAGTTWKLALRRLFALVYAALLEREDIDPLRLLDTLRRDHAASGDRAAFETVIRPVAAPARAGTANRRQLRWSRATAT